MRIATHICNAYITQMAQLTLRIQHTLHSTALNLFSAPFRAPIFTDLRKSFASM